MAWGLSADQLSSQPHPLYNLKFTKLTTHPFEWAVIVINRYK